MGPLLLFTEVLGPNDQLKKQSFENLNFWLIMGLTLLCRIIFVGGRGSLQTSLLCIVGQLKGGGSVAVAVGHQELISHSLCMNRFCGLHCTDYLKTQLSIPVIM